MINTNVNDIESALSSIDADNQQWEIKLLRNIQELASLSKQNNNANKKLVGYQKQISELYQEKANQTLQEERFDAADGYVDTI